MAHTRVYPMDSQRYDMALRPQKSKYSGSTSALMGAGISPTFVQRHFLFSRINSQRFDPLLRPSIRLRRSQAVGSPSVVITKGMMLEGSPMSKPKPRRPLGLLSRMDSQRFDPSLKSKNNPSIYNLTVNATLRDNTHINTGTTLSSSPTPEHGVLRASDDLSTLTDASLSLGTTTTHQDDGIFEDTRSNFASSTTSISQFSDTSTPWRDRSYPTDEGHELTGHYEGAKSRITRSSYILKTAPPYTRFLCGLDCRNSTLTTFDLVQPVPVPPESGNVIPAVIRLP